MYTSITVTTIVNISNMIIVITTVIIIVIIIMISSITITFTINGKICLAG